jgi:hypothetical protein
VQVLHEAEIVAEKVVVAADGWQADRKTHDDNRGARPPRGQRRRRGGDAVIPSELQRSGSIMNISR